MSNPREHKDYETLLKLGEGRHTEVISARIVETGQKVAIKQLKDEYRGDAYEVQQLRDASRFLSNLPDYDHIIRVYGMVPENDWLILEYMEGSMADKLAQKPDGLPPDMVRSLLHQALEGLQVLHRAKRYHGNLKPANLLIDEQGRVKLGDSPGLMDEETARTLDPSCKYMAPEQLNTNFGEVGAGTDLYILGFSALELLKGTAFNSMFRGTASSSTEAKSAWMRLHGSREEAIPSAAKIIPGLPPDLTKVIDRMLQKDVKLRYASAEEAERDLNAANDAPITLAVERGPEQQPATASTTAAQTAPGKKLDKRLIYAAAAVLLLVVALAMWSLRASPEPETVELKLTTTPEGATVTFLDPDNPNKPPSAKKTPNTYNVFSKKQVVRIEKAGFQTLEKEIDPTKDKELKLDLKQLVETVTVQFDGEPGSASLQVDGKDYKTPCKLELKPGKHAVALSKAGYFPSSRELLVPDRPGKEMQESYTLEPYVNLKVDSKPGGVRIWIDGEEKGATPIPGIKLRPMKYKLTVEKLITDKKVKEDAELVVRGDPGSTMEIDVSPPPMPPMKLPARGDVIENDMKMKLVYIPPGTFMMGSPADAMVKHDDEMPQHEVTLTKGYFLGMHEVTIGQFKQFVNETGHQTDAEKDGQGGWGYDKEKNELDRKTRFTWQKTGWPMTDAHPVINVSWNDAQAFCLWLSRKEKKKYRLPTEAEWEYACRAETKTAYQGGDDPETLAIYGNVPDATAKALFRDWEATIKAKDGYAFTAPVGQFKENNFKLKDMHGNVWEWCADKYSATEYRRGKCTDPPGPLNGDLYVFRGGSWGNQARTWGCRSPSRDRGVATLRLAELGFRVCHTPGETFESRVLDFATVQCDNLRPVQKVRAGGTNVGTSLLTCSTRQVNKLAATLFPATRSDGLEIAGIGIESCSCSCPVAALEQAILDAEPQYHRRT